MMRRTILTVSVLAFTIISLISAPAFAQKPEIPAAAGGWRVECSANGKALDCRAFIEAVQRDSHQVITSFTVRCPTETKKPVMMVQVPLGVLATEPITISVDNGQPERTPIQTCTRAGCFAGRPISDAMIAAMQSGKLLKIVFQDMQKQPISVSLPLAGFALAYNKIKG